MLGLNPHCPVCKKTAIRVVRFDNRDTAISDEPRLQCYLLVCADCDAMLGAVSSPVARATGT